MNYQTIGVCSICGGEVRQFVGAWMGVIPPTPKCSKCGAIPAGGPVIQMRPVRRQIDPSTYDASEFGDDRP